MYCDNSFYNEYVLDNGIVLQKYPQIDGFNGVPTVADFGTGKYRRQVIFDTSNPCTHYYLNGGNVKSCKIDSTVRAINGVPVASDFTDSDYIFDTSSPCDLYYLDGGTVTKCNPTVIGYTGQPPASAFSGGAEFIRDRSKPCDVYYLSGGTVTKCSSGGGGLSTGGSFDVGTMIIPPDPLYPTLVADGTVTVQGYAYASDGSAPVTVNGVNMVSVLLGGMMLHVGDVLHTDGPAVKFY